MKLTVNGEAIEADAVTLERLLEELAYEGDWLATAVDGEIVLADARSTFRLRDDARIEILSPMQGG